MKALGLSTKAAGASPGGNPSLYHYWLSKLTPKICTALTGRQTVRPSLPSPLQYSPAKSKCQQGTRQTTPSGISHVSQRGARCLVNSLRCPEQEDVWLTLQVSVLCSFLNSPQTSELNECSQPVSQQGDTKMRPLSEIIRYFLIVSWHIQCPRYMELSPYVPLPL